MFKIGKTYFLNIDDNIYLGKFIGCFGAHDNIFEFDYQVDAKTKRSVLLTRSEAEVSVLNVV